MAQIKLFLVAIMLLMAPLVSEAVEPVIDLLDQLELMG